MHVTRPSNISHFVAWTALPLRFLCMASPLPHKNTSTSLPLLAALVAI